MMISEIRTFPQESTTWNMDIHMLLKTLQTFMRCGTPWPAGLSPFFQKGDGEFLILGKIDKSSNSTIIEQFSFDRLAVLHMRVNQILSKALDSHLVHFQTLEMIYVEWMRKESVRVTTLSAHAVATRDRPDIDLPISWLVTVDAIKPLHRPEGMSAVFSLMGLEQYLPVELKAN